MSDDNPFSSKSRAPEDDDNPFSTKTPAARMVAQSVAPSGTDWADVGKGFAGGLGRGVAGLAGLPGDVAEYGARGIDWATRKIGGAIGVDVPQREARAPTYGSADATRALESYTGPLYQPKTIPGQYASTLGEFAPAALIPGGGGVAARVANTVVPAVASETAGQLTKGTSAEPWARGIAGVAGGLAGAKAITPTAPATAARAADVALLEREGIPLTASQRTGSEGLRRVEATAADMPWSGKAVQAQQEVQSSALDRALTERVFDRNELIRRGLDQEARLPQPAVMAEGKQSLSDEYARLAAANQLRSDPALQRDLMAARMNYQNLALPSQRAGGVRDINAIYSDIVNNLVAGQGRMPGDVYQATRSRMGKLAQGVQNSDPTLSNSLKDIRGALDRAMQRNLSPQDAAAWALNNQRWANMKQITQAAARAGEHLSPQGVAQALRSGRAGQYASGAGNMDALARAATNVIKPFPQSGTASRLGWQQLFGLPGVLTGTGGAAGSAFGPIGAVAGALAPHLATRAVVSRPGQAYLGNQVLPQNARDVIAQTLAQQALTQPGLIERNRAAQADYEQRRRQERRRAGLQ